MVGTGWAEGSLLHLDMGTVGDALRSPGWDRSDFTTEPFPGPLDVQFFRPEKPGTEDMPHFGSCQQAHVHRSTVRGVFSGCYTRGSEPRSGMWRVVWVRD